MDDNTPNDLAFSILYPVVIIAIAIGLGFSKKDDKSDEICIEKNDSLEESNIVNDVDFENIYKVTTSTGEEHYCTLMTVVVNENTSVECYYDVYSEKIIAFKGQEELSLTVEKINNDDYTNESENKLKVKSIS